jgi:hypothetical protein
VERDGHDSVCGVESFLYTIAMMNVDVNVEDTGLETEEFDYAENDVLESNQLALFALWEAHLPLI